MTFTQAAEEVLRLAKRPLHYKKITEFAIARNMLSHVGKTPEVTMSSRLATMVKNDRGDAPIIKVRPGVFGLREFDEEVLKQADAGDLPDLEELPEAEVESASEEETEQPTPSTSKSEEDDDSDDDDDENALILGGSDNDDEETSRPRRRRRRRRRGGSRAEGQDASETSSPRESARPSQEEPESREPLLDEIGYRDTQVPDNALLGKSLADAIHAVMSDGPRRPCSAVRVAELLISKGRLSGDSAALTPTVAASLRADGARRAKYGERPRFRQLSSGRVVLTDWALTREALRYEQEAAKAAKAQQHEVARAMWRRLDELSGAGFAELMATWLNALGFSALRAVRTPSTADGALRLAGNWRQGLTDVRCGVVIFRNKKSVDASDVVELRGSAHHYGQADLLWLVTTGEVSSPAQEEASFASHAPCVVYDGLSLAKSMEECGVGIRPMLVHASALDFDLLESLGGVPAPAPERSGRERGWQRNEGRSSRSSSGRGSRKGDSSSSSRRRSGGFSNEDDGSKDHTDSSEDAASTDDNGSTDRNASKGRSASTNRNGADPSEGGAESIEVTWDEDQKSPRESRSTRAQRNVATGDSDEASNSRRRTGSDSHKNVTSDASAALEATSTEKGTESSEEEE